MNVFTPKEQCTQLYFRDDGNFIFRRLPIENSFLVEKQNDAVLNAWMMPYKLLKKFQGYKNIQRGKILMCYGRDILLDPFGQLKDDEKPEKGKSLVKNFIKEIATATLYRHEHLQKKSVIDKMVIPMAIVMVVFGIAIAIIAAI